MQTMSKTLTFEIDRDDKAVLYILGEEGSDISCMVDTGANVPIWFMGENFLKLRYPSAVKTEQLTIIHGLGKEPIVDVPVWKIPKFVLTDDEGKSIVFHDMYIPVIEAKNYSFNMLIPLTMLNRTKFTFDYQKSASYGYLTIEAEKENYYVHPIFVKENQKYLNKVQTFLEGES